MNQQLNVILNLHIRRKNRKRKENQKEEDTHNSIMGSKKGTAFSIPSIFARDCTNAMGIMKKKVRKKKATAMMSLRILSETYGIARLSQYISRGSGAHSVNHIVGFLDC